MADSFSFDDVFGNGLAFRMSFTSLAEQLKLTRQLGKMFELLEAGIDTLDAEDRLLAQKNLNAVRDAYRTAIGQTVAWCREYTTATAAEQARVQARAAEKKAAAEKKE